MTDDADFCMMRAMSTVAQLQQYIRAQLREHKDLDALAQRVGVSRRTLYNLRTGTYPSARMSTLEALEGYFRGEGAR